MSGALGQADEAEAADGPDPSGGELISLAGPQLLARFERGQASNLVDMIEGRVRAIETDISTEAGRAAIKSLAYQVSRSKTALDEAGKQLTEGFRLKTNAVDAERRMIRSRLDALRNEVLQPLEEWKECEMRRLARHEDHIRKIAEMGTVDNAFEPMLPDIDARLEALQAPSLYDAQEFTKRAEKTRAAAIANLLTIRQQIVWREAERAEAEAAAAREAARQRQLAEQARVEREARIAEQAAEAARREAEARAETAAEAARRMVQEKIELAEAAQRQAEAARQAAEARAQRAEQARIEQAREAAVNHYDNERRHKRERDAALLQEQTRAAEKERREAAAREARRADQVHREQINDGVMSGLRNAGLCLADAVSVLNAIARGDVPNVAIAY